MDEPRWRTFAFYFLCCNLTLAAIVWGITNELICMGLAVRSPARVEGVRAEVALWVFDAKALHWTLCQAGSHACTCPFSGPAMRHECALSR